MNNRPVKALKIIQVPYDETNPMWKVRVTDENHEAEIESFITRPEGRRELDDYVLCGTYLTAGLPFDVTSINSVNQHKPHEEQTYEISKLCQLGIKEGKCVVMTGGGCSHALGIIGGLQKSMSSDTKIGFIWLDAHGDFNTPESTESGLVGGTPLAAIAGLCQGKAYRNWMMASGLERPIPTENIILSDGRDIDPKEMDNLKRTKINLLNTDAFNDLSTWTKTVKKLAENVDVIYLHIDEDILDAKYTPGQYTARTGGPSIETTMRNIKVVMDTEKVIAFSLVSVFHENANPYKELCTLNGMRIISSAFNNWHFTPLFND